MTKILVTGAAGFIGSHLVNRLAKQKNLEVSVLVKPGQEKKFPNEVSLIQGDITQDLSSVKEHFNFVFHLAAYNFTHVGGTGLKDAITANAFGTANVLNSLSFDSFVYLSSANVYDQQIEGKIDEASPANPTTDYAITKYFGELFCKRKMSEKNIIIFRSTNVYGTGQPAKALVPVWANNALKNEPITVFRPPNKEMQLLFVDDIADAFISVIEKNPKSSIFNLATDETIKLLSVAEKIKEKTNSSSEIKIAAEETKIQQFIDFSKARKELGWKPKTSLDKGLQATINWIKKR